jgi:hypothetical protein
MTHILNYPISDNNFFQEFLYTCKQFMERYILGVEKPILKFYFNILICYEDIEGF